MFETLILLFIVSVVFIAIFVFKRSSAENVFKRSSTQKKIVDLEPQIQTSASQHPSPNINATGDPNMIRSLSEISAYGLEQIAKHSITSAAKRREKVQRLVSSTKLDEYSDGCKAGEANTVQVELFNKGNPKLSLVYFQKALGHLPKELLVLNSREQITLRAITQKAKANSLRVYFSIKEEMVVDFNIAAIIAKHNEKSHLLLNFTYNNESVFKLPILIKEQPAPRLNIEVSKFRLTSYLDWEKLKVYVQDKSLDNLLKPLTITNTSLVKTKKKGKDGYLLSLEETPLLHVLQALKKERIPVHIRLGSGNSKSEWVEIVNVINDRSEGTKGVYLNNDGHKLDAFIRSSKQLVRYEDLEPFIVDDKLSKRRHRTHVVTPLPEIAYKRLTLRLDSQALKGILASPRYDRTPLVELKTPVYNYYCDIDLDWEKLSLNKAVLAFKEAQLAYFGGKDKAFAPVVNIIGTLFPQGDIAKAMMLAARPHHKGKKEGYHLIFGELQLRNDGLQGELVTGMMEKVFALKVLQTSKDSVQLFLAQLIWDDAAYLKVKQHPIQFYVTKQLLHDISYELPFDGFCQALSEGVRLFPSSRKNAEGESVSAQLMRFGLQLLDQALLEQYYTNFLSLKDVRARYQLVVRLIRRIRWELRRRLNFFDHSVYQRGMGLRMIGNQKIDAPESRYLPATQTATPPEIAAFSIRSSKKTGLSPAAPFLSLWQTLDKWKSVRVNSLAGLISQTRIERQGAYIAHLLLELKMGAQPGKEILLSCFDRPGQWRSSVTDYDLPFAQQKLDNKTPLLVRHQNKYRLIYPPLKRDLRGSQSIRRYYFSSSLAPLAPIEFRVRVFIPSPAVGGPFAVDFGGDNRAPKYSGGTSRIEIQVTLDMVTGEIISRTGGFGETTAYNHEDTEVLLDQPNWWLDLEPGATPVERATHPVDWDHSLIASVSKDANGNSIVTLGYHAANPLTNAPPIDGNFQIEIDPAAGEIQIEGAHDGFPQHTLFCNGEMIYNHDPVATGDSPMSLFGSGDVRPSFRVSIPPTQSLPSTPPTTIPDLPPEGLPPQEDGMSYDDGGPSWEGDGEISHDGADLATLTFGDSSETFGYDDEDGTWDGEYGSSIDGGNGLFGGSGGSSTDISIGLEPEDDELYMTLSDANGTTSYPVDPKEDGYQP